MTYSKPELLAAEAALDAIYGSPKIYDFLDSEPQATVSAYEVDE